MDVGGTIRANNYLEKDSGKRLVSDVVCAGLPFICTKDPNSSTVYITPPGCVPTNACSASNPGLPSSGVCQAANGGEVGCCPNDMVTTGLNNCGLSCSTNWGCRQWTACFVAGTLVATPAGQVAIEKIAMGDTVYSMDPATRVLIPNTVLETFVHEVDNVLRVKLADGISLDVTPEHRFFDPASGQYREIGRFHAGEKVLRFEASSGSREVEIIGIEKLPPGKTAVFNFHVGSFQNYLAGGVLVHNKKLL